MLDEPLSSFILWYALDIRRPIRNLKVDLVLNLFAIGRLTVIDWKTLEDQMWFTYNYNEGSVTVLPVELPPVHQRASGVEVC